MKVMVLGGKGESTNAVIHALHSTYPDMSVILEEDVPFKTFIKRRIRRFGFWVVVGQMIFVFLIPRHLRRRSRDRVAEIKYKYGLNTADIFSDTVRRYDVKSINDDAVIEIIKKENPEIIIVNGTRIISAKILDSVDIPFVNMHVGITPKYRGVHGGYWAAANGDVENCGVTIHLVNTGIDTGDIIAQKRIEITERDNYVTYPYIQVGEGIKLEQAFLKEYETTRQIRTIKSELPSMMWSHPTIIQYFKNRKRSR